MKHKLNNRKKLFYQSIGISNDLIFKRPNPRKHRLSHSCYIKKWLPSFEPNFESKILSIDIFQYDSKNDQNQIIMKDVPLCFNSSQHYGNIFLPLILCEGLEEIKCEVNELLHNKKKIKFLYDSLFMSGRL